MELPKRKHNRLNCFDYGTTGCYFITLCTQERQRLFEIEQPQCNIDTQDSIVSANIANTIIKKWLNEIPNKYPNMQIDTFVIMPDHIHFILRIRQCSSGAALPDVMRFFKTMTTNHYLRCIKERIILPFNKKLWQKSYYDHIIRNQADYNEVWEYIENNPAKWFESHS